MPDFPNVITLVRKELRADGSATFIGSDGIEYASHSAGLTKLAQTALTEAAVKQLCYKVRK